MTDIRLVFRRKHGLDTYLVIVNGAVKHTFMSEAHARTRFTQLRLQYGI